MTLIQYVDENNIDDDEINLKASDLENVLNVYKDDRANWFYNLNSTVKINIDLSQLLEYVCKTEGHWPLVSYNIYGTTRLAWVLMQINNVKAINMFLPLLPGDKVYYLSKEHIGKVVNTILDYAK